jgi:hypothetical protein
MNQGCQAPLRIMLLQCKPVHEVAYSPCGPAVHDNVYAAFAYDSVTPLTVYDVEQFPVCAVLATHLDSQKYV